MKAGFVNIFGKPNAGKSTLLNALVGEKLAIVSNKVQTTRHRIKGFLTTPEYQIIFSDTPGIIEPKYKLHERMMGAVKSSLEDADVALLLVDITDDLAEADVIFTALRLKVAAIVVLNKKDKASPDQLKAAVDFFTAKEYAGQVIAISALQPPSCAALLKAILALLPEGDPFYANDDLTDLPEKFFVGEIVREKIYELYEEEIPYQTTVMVQEFKVKSTLTKIGATIVVQRESQKAILLGRGGEGIKKLGTLARKDIETFVGGKVFLELFVKVRPKWRDNELYLKEYGY